MERKYLGRDREEIERVGARDSRGSAQWPTSRLHLYFIKCVTLICCEVLFIGQQLSLNSIQPLY